MICNDIALNNVFFGSFPFKNIIKNMELHEAYCAFKMMINTVLVIIRNYFIVTEV